jgi:hypothetical protein
MPQSDLYLAREQLAALTGTVQPKRMCAWLTSNGWPFVPPARRGDVPKVLRTCHDERLSGRTPAPQQSHARLNLDWMLNPAGARDAEASPAPSSASVEQPPGKRSRRGP